MFRRVGLLASRLAFATLIAVAPTLPVWQGGVAEAAPRFQTAATTETRLDPHLQAYLAGSPSRMTVVPVRPVNGTVRARGVAQPAGVNVLIEATRDIRADLRTLGANARTRASRSGIYTATVPLNALQAVANLAGVIKVTASMPTRPSLDDSLVDAKIVDGNAVRPTVNGSITADGDGTLVAIVDSGIDLAHDDFKDGGATRIDAVWDQTVNLNGPGPGAITGGSRPVDDMGYGTVCTAAEIDAGSCAQTDTTGHGTHVASIAAGNSGAAPASRLLVVKHDGSTGGAVDAWAWIIAKASELNKPVVINNSWGSHNGAHDGTAVEERALDDFAQLSGVAFVVAAGDDGNKAIHARSGTAPVATLGTKSVAFVPTSTSASINFWYSADDNFSISLMHNGTQTAKAIKGGRTRSYSLAGATISISNCNSASTSNNLCQATVTLTGMTPADQDWSVELDRTSLARASSTGTWDAWVTTDNATFNTPSYRTTLAEPATASGAISVGSFVADGLTTGAYSAFSALGPTRDGRAKPDLLAPGESITAAASGTTNLTTAKQGTSMAAPHVAGIVAMMYQKNAGYTQSQIRDALLGTNA
ncbi:MAG: S8 family serine peptidase, partial [Chloroflexota bacterium]